MVFDAFQWNIFFLMHSYCRSWDTALLKCQRTHNGGWSESFDAQLCTETHTPATIVPSAKSWRVLSLSLILSAWCCLQLDFPASVCLFVHLLVYLMYFGCVWLGMIVWETCTDHKQDMMYLCVFCDGTVIGLVLMVPTGLKITAWAQSDHFSYL